MEEIWKAIPCAKYYEASSNGNVRSINRTIKNSLGRVCNITGRRIRPGKNNAGYLFFYPRPGKSPMAVHRAVLSAFVGNCPEMQCNHKNGVKTDNRIENLEWVSPKENLRHAVRTGLHGRFTDDDVRVIRFFHQTKRGNGGTVGILAKLYKCNRNSITKIANGTRYIHIK